MTLTNGHTQDKTHSHGRLARSYRLNAQRKQQQQRKTDKALVKDYVAGDHRAFALIVERHRQRMMAVARKYARNEHDAQDIVQDALFKASRNMHTFRSESALTTWLHRLVLNAGYDHAKRADNKRQHTSLDDEEKLTQDANRYLAHDPLGNLDRLVALRQAVLKLPAAQQRALMLIDVAGHSINSAASHLGVRPGTVKSRRNRARQALTETLTG
ncbi:MULTISPECIES: sigma-70 family RNA polymerase sigma factor [unclassified Corynebacterium]|mgnify:FL=1|uniref:sigma-70 family RNA polymerase sigma factor n=1 Tax=unclassified Corynebacterium TaxID=2624378 RepID=UPI0026556D20|nr:MULTISPECIES: sigma-70 family RNA polymerase sigma factor [unclassified Corynebacterium]MDN8594269.1 sigma-70 family RNA polymerase sigma factor [Corynebacterium sp. P4_F2]WKK55185.1 sigma-70 family RNA polymerase sigma factor [Corynebacterium sp. P4-C1]